MNLRKIGVVAAMWVLGLASIAFFAWTVEWLDGQRVQAAEAAEAPAPVAERQPLAALTAGAARSAATARHDLAEGHRSEASHAIDAAWRAAEVGLETSHGQVKQAYEAALRRLHFARQDLHYGRAGSARDELRQVVTALEPVIGRARELSPGVPSPVVWPGYRHAVLLDATGSMIGKVRGIERGQDGSPVAVVHVGGSNDVLGFLDFGGRTVRVPADQLLWGPRGFVGAVYVALPVQATEDIRGIG
ncbi:hypothetical protein B0I33_104551 [Prauserella shujinwangii]|uniref:Uncharacterized protein n=1 Tax=Prauserella shujinwangii TaxID=1453103 RepID=A0A2T0LXI3_9PSEU|nr:hypothetical protein [Prauserella shujinwangii]PRX48733.1 hypothetical protein B0I33_104551 [Prauserella shujinwangii]